MARQLQHLVRVDSAGEVSLARSSADGTGLTQEQFDELRRGLTVYNQAVANGLTEVDIGSDSRGPRFLGFSATSAEAWNSQWVRCYWWGCKFALNHYWTQQLITAINNSGLWNLWGNVNTACLRATGLVVACPVLAAEVVFAGKVIAWQLGRQDRGGGVYINATYWREWPGITSQ
jgi:hypothetical protein